MEHYRDMLEVIKQNIRMFFFMYAEQGYQYALLVFVVMLFVYGIFTRRIGKAIYRSFVTAVLVFYGYCMVGITLLSRTEGYTRNLNLTLFSTFGKDFYSRMYIYENILLFVPLGIILFFQAKAFRYFVISAGTGILCSLGIEIAQVLTQLGMFQIDDILTNTIGMLIGFFICKIPQMLVQGIGKCLERM